MEHTQGEWEVSEKAYNQVKTKAKTDGTLTFCRVYGESREQVEAKAKLIAASPSLLAACEEAFITFACDDVRRAMGDTPYTIACRKLQAAIALATT